MLVGGLPQGGPRTTSTTLPPLPQHRLLRLKHTLPLTPLVDSPNACPAAIAPARSRRSATDAHALVRTWPGWEGKGAGREQG